MIDIELPYDHIIEQLRRLVGRLENRRELMGRLAGVMHRTVEDNFESEGRPAWQALHPGTVAARRKAGKDGKILQRDGALAASITPFHDDNQAVVGTNVAYAAIHQFGGQTKPHVIKPRYKRALAFGGVIVRQVQHPGSKIPARPFLVLTPEDGQDLVEEAQDYLLEQINRM